MRGRIRDALLIALAFTVLGSLASIAPAAAAAARSAAPSTAVPVPQTSSHGRTLADHDGDRISDDLDGRLARTARSTRIDVVATFADRASLRDARSTLRAGTLGRSFSLIDGFSARLTTGQIRSLARRPGVIRVERNFAVHALDDAASRDFGVSGARTDFGVTGAGVEVCIPDTGVDPNHEQLDSKTPIAWLDLINGQASAYDDQGHGTHVASIAVGDGVGSSSLADRMKGVAPAAALSAVKVLDSTGAGDDSLVVTGIQWCADRASVGVISLSLGSTLPSDGLDAVSQAVDAAVLTKGKIVVVAAGNSGDLPDSITSPGSAVQAITVGAAAEWSAPLNSPYRSEGPYLAPFSSRGPTDDGRIKPDIVAPGETIDAALAGTTSGYAVESGTSMATPFVAGTAALLRQLQPTWTQADVRADIEATAFDVGPIGKDDDWGAGLLDGYAAVARAAGGSGHTAFPTYRHLTGIVADGGTWTRTFTLASGELGAPIAATITLNGAPVCVLDLGPLGCLAYEWSPDLDAELVDPSGLVVASSTCAAAAECGVGRQETLHTTPTAPGTYAITITPFADTPNNGKGGSFSVDLFTGPVGSTTPPPPQSLHVGDLDRSSRLVTNGWRATATITAHDQNHGLVAGVTVTGVWTGNTTASCVTNANGRCSVAKTFPKKRASATFTVTKLKLSGYTYNATDNHDPDGDSTGTAITIKRPA
ncbi:MAG: S8 family serine peptidase [Actinomycetota bacterium]|nr:S8 family serine peptidase [Actinomycetota bacterium]